MLFIIEIDGRRYHLTPWQSGSRKPERQGVYQRNFPAGPYSCWDGEAWCGDATSPSSAAAEREHSPHQHASWRGLAEPPPPVRADH